MLKTVPELLLELGMSIRARRLGRNWSQDEAARRAGMGLSTWARMETSGQATIENLVHAAVALRCEERLLELFPAPAARSMDELLQQQRDAQPALLPQRARARMAKRKKP
jgi:transcriptional regulator with XRE-family HTH domain